MTLPVLYSFRRCPYAIRARLAIRAAGVPVELREILLREKAVQFLATSPSGTVPCLRFPGGEVLDESYDIMRWALTTNDPSGWLDQPDNADALIDEADGPFKTALDRTKYASRYPECDAGKERAKAAEFLHGLDERIAASGWLCGDAPRLADMAILPFVRQFAFTDKRWFDAQDWPALSAWLERFLGSSDFGAVMGKYPVWQSGDPVTAFP